MNWFGWSNNLKIWVRLVAIILAGTICSGVGLIYWGTLQQKKIAVDQAQDFAESVYQMTMAGLTGMMITGQVAQRNIFLDQIRDSNHIESLKVFRGRPVVLQFGEGHAGELPNSADFWGFILLDDAIEYRNMSLDQGSAIFRIGCLIAGTLTL